MPTRPKTGQESLGKPLAQAFPLIRQYLKCRNSRRKDGSILALGAVILLAVVMLFMFGNELAWLFLQQERYQQAVEASALKAASDLSEIVINDPNFGFISLTDRPAIGKATQAADGEPVPVRGINTIIATARLDYIIATELGNGQLQEFALQDARNARDAAVRLNKALEEALKVEPKQVPHDMDGNIVHPYADALNAYNASLMCFTNAPPKEFELTLGWLGQTGSTITPVPVQPRTKVKDQYVPIGGEVNQCYKAGVDLPVGNEHFHLASLGPQPSLARVDDFLPTDPSHVCSVIKVEAVGQAASLLPWDKSVRLVNGRACGQSYAIVSQPAPSVLILAFSDGRPVGINCIRDLFSTEGLNNATMKVYRPVNGDFPIDPHCQLVACSDNLADCAASAFIARSFYDWLRSNYTLPKIDSLLDAFSQKFIDASQGGSVSNVFATEITADGNAVVSCLRANPFQDLRIAESQLYGINGQPVPIGPSNWTVVCRDEVNTLGTINGGQHAGQPLAGNPINWAELDSYVDDRFATAAATRRPSAVTISGKRQPGGGIDLSGAQLGVTNKQSVHQDIRKSSCSAGLASEIRITSPVAPN
jgi:hypothetical protein